ncbi:hypothetical protein G210_0982 [Candida maltosa Xu316]|uniref:SWIM-type domain-containing protein n=1 Tax=Candida maltosa (strain Xu316) TaxID=1245528 RepID=M3JZK0_CANMX|nr:hypothetical protein G210_0982 [Candida maltosa Xu316]
MASQDELPVVDYNVMRSVYPERLINFLTSTDFFETWPNININWKRTFLNPASDEVYFERLKSKSYRQLLYSEKYLNMILNDDIPVQFRLHKLLYPEALPDDITKEEEKIYFENADECFSWLKVMATRYGYMHHKTPRVVSYDWSVTYRCCCSGIYRGKSASPRTKKVGCKSHITARKDNSGVISATYVWRHTNHSIFDEKDTFLPESMENWAHSMKEEEEGFYVKYRTNIVVDDDSSGKVPCFSFTMQSDLQRKIMKEYGSVVTMDITRCGTSTAKKDERIYLLTLMVFDYITGNGYPISLSVINSDSDAVIATALIDLISVGLNPTTMLIDCSATQVSAVKIAFSKNIPLVDFTGAEAVISSPSKISDFSDKYNPTIPNINYCLLHVDKNFQDKLKRYFTTTDEHQALLTGWYWVLREFLYDLMFTRDGSLLMGKITNIYEQVKKFQAESPTSTIRGKMTRLTNQYLNPWIDDLKYWCDACFVSDLSMRYNNLLESYHDTMNTQFFAADTKRRLDMIIYLLAKKIIPFFKNQHESVLMGITPRVNNNYELQQNSIADAIPERLVPFMVDFKSPTIADVQSMDGDQYYRVEFVDQLTANCSCASNRTQTMFCMHMFLFLRATKLQKSEEEIQAVQNQFNSGARESNTYSDIIPNRERSLIGLQSTLTHQDDTNDGEDTYANYLSEEVIADESAMDLDNEFHYDEDITTEFDQYSDIPNMEEENLQKSAQPLITNGNDANGVPRDLHFNAVRVEASPKPGSLKRRYPQDIANIYNVIHDTNIVATQHVNARNLTTDDLEARKLEARILEFEDYKRRLLNVLSNPMFAEHIMEPENRHVLDDLIRCFHSSEAYLAGVKRRRRRKSI